jgi:hypothetical protein
MVTTPWPSRNRSGSTPWYVTWIACAPSVTRKCTTGRWPLVVGSRCTLPDSTSPPRRKARSGVGRCSAVMMSDGERKKTRLSWKAVSVSAVALPRPMAQSSRIHILRFFLVMRDRPGDRVA